MRPPSLLQIQEAIIKNVCPASEDEEQNFTIHKALRSSVIHEGDSQLSLVLLVGLATYFGYEPQDITLFADIKREEFRYKLSKFRHKALSNDKRFLNKVRLIKNYLKLVYNVNPEVY